MSIWDEIGKLQRELIGIGEFALTGEVQIARLRMRMDALEERVSALEGNVGDRVVSFIITQIGVQGMAIKGIAPGGIGTFSATPVDVNGNPDSLPAGIVPAWSLIPDTVGSVVLANADGLSASVTIAASAPPGAPFTIKVDAALADGSKPEGTASVPVFTLEVKSFVIDQLS